MQIVILHYDAWQDTVSFLESTILEKSKLKY